MNFSKIKLQMIQEKNYRYNSKIIKSAKDIVKYINDIEELDKATEENMLLICLNARNNIIAYSQVAKGGLDYCNIDLKTIFKTILLSNANKFILCHNHPSGTPRPSAKDINVTNMIKDMSKVMGVQFLDHIVIANDDFVSCI